MPPPCEAESGVGVDPLTGLCPLGMPVLLAENMLATEIWGDVNLFGWPMTRDLHDLELTPVARGDLLTKLRVLADEAATIQREKYEQRVQEMKKNAGHTTGR